MIRVTQGHEKSISIEVFLKSFILLSSVQQEKIVFYANIEEVKLTAQSIGIRISPIDKNYISVSNTKLRFVNITHQDNHLTTTALEKAISDMSKKDILVTMPSSKDQIVLNGKTCSGHTDYFRKLYKSDNIVMCFKNKWENILLLTDHIPLSQVSSSITKDMIQDKVSTAIEGLNNIENVIFAGLNPHAGENGLLGKEESLFFNEAIIELKKKFPLINFSNPLAADSIHKYTCNKSLKVFCYHDQGLVYFKSKYNFIGANITLGLPFQRISVDHGTAFDLYLKNKANYMGCYTILNDLLG